MAFDPPCVTEARPLQSKTSFEEEKAHRIEIGQQFVLELMHDDQNSLAFGSLYYCGHALRSNLQPWSLYFESDEGWRFDTFSLQEVRKDGDVTTVVLTSCGRWNPRIQTGDAMGDSRMVAPRLNAPRATVSWQFRPVVERIMDNTWHGIAMNISVECPGAPTNWILESATWELGGDADGCMLIQQDVSTIDLEQVTTTEGAFSTIEAFHTKENGAWGGSYPMDMLPRAAGSCICDFQAKDEYALCLFAESPGLTRARIDKYADESVIHYLDRPFFPKSESFTAPERKLLVYKHPQPMKKFEWRNLWLDCFEEVRRRILDHYGLEVQSPLPSVHAHLWDNDLKERNETWTHDLMKTFPLWGELGFKEVITHGVWDSATSDPDRRPGDGNICCPYSFTFAERFGGNAGMKELQDCAEENDLDVYQWYGFQFDQNSPVWKEHPEWLLREQHGEPWDGAYNKLWCGRMRSGFADYLRDQILAIQEKTGIKSMFIDSYQNLGVTCVDWQSPDQAPQAEEIWGLQSELQKKGARFRCEVVTIFGVSHVAMFGFSQDKFRRRLWETTAEQDALFALIDCSPAFMSGQPVFSQEHISPEWYFRLVAHRAIPPMHANPWKGRKLPGGDLIEEYARVNKLYNRVLSSMHRLRLVDGGTHVIWQDDAKRPSVIWTFDNVELESQSEIRNEDSGEILTPDSNGLVSLQKFQVYTQLYRA